MAGECVGGDAHAPVRILVDMNLSPHWCGVLRAAGHDALHWSSIGPPGAPDDVVMEWALRGGFCVFTHDLDFGAILWATGARGPSVIQLRGNDTLPQASAAAVLDAIDRFRHELATGAILVIDGAKARARVLPIG